MNRNIIPIISGLIITFATLNAQAQPDDISLQVWANEAIVATYTYTSNNYAQNQKKIAQYFTTQGWIAYSKALNDSKLLETVQQNAYNVSAVATAPVAVKKIDASHWTITMPILVQYQNPQYQQQQHLKVALTVTPASTGQGVRGYAISSLQATVTKPPCQCVPAKATENKAPI